ncbi:MAG: hypothetical protein N3B16_06190 [Candidatus Aminicenantes bacterium]|nr:hypothetical protein [Candidatus Aminicenantes bacterium]
MDNQRKRITITGPFLLIVEGKDDQKFFEAFIDFLSRKHQNNAIKGQFGIIKLDGKQNLTDTLKAITNTPGFDTLKAMGIILDSNSRPKSTFQSIQTALRKVQLPCPERELKIIGRKPKISIMLIPGIERPGEIEDLCLRAVSQDTAMKCLKIYFACLKKNKIKISLKESKARCLAFLASRENLAHDIGIAAQKSIWPFENSAFSKIKKFILNLIQE